jgi:hypothetical protein
MGVGAAGDGLGGVPRDVYLFVRLDQRTLIRELASGILKNRGLADNPGRAECGLGGLTGLISGCGEGAVKGAVVHQEAGG